MRPDVQVLAANGSATLTGVLDDGKPEWGRAEDCLEQSRRTWDGELYRRKCGYNDSDVQCAGHLYIAVGRELLSSRELQAVGLQW